MCDGNLLTKIEIEILEIFISSKFSYGNHDLFNTGDVKILKEKKGKFIYFSKLNISYPLIFISIQSLFRGISNKE